MYAELPAAAVSVLQEPGDQLLLSEELQGLDLQQRPQQVRTTEQDQDQRPAATPAVCKFRYLYEYNRKVPAQFINHVAQNIQIFMRSVCLL